MPRKYKLTGCAKFFIFFIIAAPLAYIGASYYNGQNPLKEVQEWVQSFSNNGDDSEEATMDQNVNAAPSNAGQGSVYKEMELKELEIKSLKNDLKDCEQLNKKQKEVIESQKLEITNLKQRLDSN
jgi:hypothetical protein